MASTVTRVSADFMPAWPATALPRARHWPAPCRRSWCAMRPRSRPSVAGKTAAQSACGGAKTNDRRLHSRLDVARHRVAPLGKAFRRRQPVVVHAGTGMTSIEARSIITRSRVSSRSLIYPFVEFAIGQIYLPRVRRDGCARPATRGHDTRAAVWRVWRCAACLSGDLRDRGGCALTRASLGPCSAAIPLGGLADSLQRL
jgi:hypothetical protein